MHLKSGVIRPRELGIVTARLQLNQPGIMNLERLGKRIKNLSHVAQDPTASQYCVELLLGSH